MIIVSSLKRVLDINFWLYGPFNARSFLTPFSVQSHGLYRFIFNSQSVSDILFDRRSA